MKNSGRVSEKLTPRKLSNRKEHLKIKLNLGKIATYTSLQVNIFQ